MTEDPSSFLFLVNSFSEIGYIVLLILLLSMSALISSSENAFFSLSPNQLEEIKKNKWSEGVFFLLKDKKSLLATILISNNFINIGIVLLISYLTDFVYQNIFEGLSEKYTMIIKVGGITFIILLFGEIIPKIYANNKALVIVKIVSPILVFLQNKMRLLINFLGFLGSALDKRLAGQKENVSIDKLSQALDITSESDVLEEQKILEGIVSFGSTSAKQVMTPRVDLFCLDGETDFKTVLKEVADNNYSRIPVYENTADKITGILYIKDLLPHFQKEEFDWKSLLRQPIYAPENKKLDDILQMFKEQKNHLAIVVDEYGGTMGVITLEDILEEIVGDISDEFDLDDINYTQLDTNTYSFDGKTSLLDFYRITNTSFEELFEQEKGENESLAGFILELCNGEFKNKQVISWEEILFTIEVADKKSIKRIKIKFPEETDTDAE